MIELSEDKDSNKKESNSPTEIIDKIINGDLIMDCSVKELLEIIANNEKIPVNDVI